jgi:hypothetical protein
MLRELNEHTMPELKSTRDLFAELYVAGLFADAGWHLYFPKRDHGFDFIITKTVGDKIVIRPVQVKGLYPTAEKTDKRLYGYRGKLTQLHSEMVLAMPYFPVSREPAPLFTAFLPRIRIRSNKNKQDQQYAYPASFIDGSPIKRPYFSRFFDAPGLALVETLNFPQEQPEKPIA